jgi:hypothetical protein
MSPATTQVLCPSHLKTGEGGRGVRIALDPSPQMIGQKGVVRATAPSLVLNRLTMGRRGTSATTTPALGVSSQVMGRRGMSWAMTRTLLRPMV